MARVKSFRNGGRLDITPDLNGIQDDYEGFFAGWRTLPRSGLFAANGAGVQVTSVGGDWRFGNWLDGADYAAGSRTVKWRVVTWMSNNQVAPAVTFTFGLYPVTITPGSSGLGPTYGVGALVAGSTCAYTSQASRAPTMVASSEFTLPSAGRYWFYVDQGAGPAAGFVYRARSFLQLRQV